MSSFSNVTMEMNSSLENTVFTNGVKWLYVTSIISFILTVSAVLFNGATIYVLYTSKSLKNIYNDFIMSMSCSNLLASVVCWINIYRLTLGFNDFQLPAFFCKMYWGIELWTVFSTALHIMIFALLRLISVKCPSKVKTFSRRHGRICHSILWFITFCFGFIPMILFIELEHKDRSRPNRFDGLWPHCSQSKIWLPVYSHYSMYAFSIFILIPIIIVAIASMITVITIRRNQNRVPRASLSEVTLIRRRKREKQALTQLILIVTSFFIGYVPFTAFEFYTQKHHDQAKQGLNHIRIVALLTYLPLRISECLDPIFYSLGSRKIRKEMLKFGKSLTSCCNWEFEDRKRNTNTVTSGGAGVSQGDK